MFRFPVCKYKNDRQTWSVDPSPREGKLQRRKIFGEGNHLVRRRRTEKEKEENIRNRKIFGQRRKRKMKL